jgi:hypothetical protein
MLVCAEMPIPYPAAVGAEHPGRDASYMPGCMCFLCGACAGYVWKSYSLLAF